MRNRWSDLIVRLGLAFAFLYPAINAYFDPYTWIGYFPAFMKGYVPDLVLLHSYGALEIVVAIWILSGWRVFWPSLAALAILLAIIVLDASDFQILFRDVSIAALALALIVAHAPFLNGEQKRNAVPIA